MHATQALRVLAKLEYPLPPGMSDLEYQRTLDQMVQNKFEMVVTPQTYGKNRDSKDLRLKCVRHGLDDMVLVLYMQKPRRSRSTVPAVLCVLCCQLCCCLGVCSSFGVAVHGGWQSAHPCCIRFLVLPNSACCHFVWFHLQVAVSLHGAAAAALPQLPEGGFP